MLLRGDEATFKGGQPSSDLHYVAVMAFDVHVEDARIVVNLRRWDRAMNWRRRVEIPHAAIEATSVVDRVAVESSVDHRAIGWGTHDGTKRPNRRRVGTMLGRGVRGKQFWAIPTGAEDSQLLVFDLTGHEFARVVLSAGHAEAVEAVIDRTISRPD